MTHYTLAIQEQIPKVLAQSMSPDAMAQLITDLAGILGVVIPVQPAGVEMFCVRMIGAATMAHRHSEILRMYQDAHLNLMGV